VIADTMHAARPHYPIQGFLSEYNVMMMMMMMMMSSKNMEDSLVCGITVLTPDKAENVWKSTYSVYGHISCRFSPSKSSSARGSAL
jgi:metal-dependent amidase/aminoacylase/carboxypeptidase family protein